MPLTQEQKLRMLKVDNLDPSKWDVSEDGNNYIPKPETQPSTSSDIITAPVKQKDTTSTLGAIGAHALESTIPTAGGFGAAAGTGALLGSPLGPIGAGIGALVAGLGASYGLSKAQSALMPDAAKQYLAKSGEEHPIASTIGGFVPAAASLNVGKGIQDLASLPSIGQRLISTGRSALSTGEKQMLQNLAINTGVGAGQDIAEQTSSDQPFNPAQLATTIGLSAALGGHPTPIGRKLGLHAPAPDQLFENPARTSAPKANIPEETTIPRNIQNDQVDALQSRLDYLRSKLKGKVTVESPQYTGMPGVEVLGKIPPEIDRANLKPEELPEVNLPKGKYALPYEDPDVNTFESEGGSTLKEKINPAEVSANNILELNKQITAERQKQFDLAQQEKLLQDSKELQQIKANQLNQPETVKGVNPQRDFTKEQQKINVENIKVPETEAERIQREYDEGIRHSAELPNNSTLTPEQRRILEKQQEEDLRWRGITPNVQHEILAQPNTQGLEVGKPVAGYYGKKERVAHISQSWNSIKVRPHEGGHGFLRDLESSTNPIDNKLAKDGLAIAGGDEEKLAESFSQKVARRNITTLYGGRRARFNQWWNDVKNHLGSKLGGKLDVEEHLANRYLNDSPYGTRAELYPSYQAFKGGSHTISNPETGAPNSGTSASTASVSASNELHPDTRITVQHPSEVPGDKGYVQVDYHDNTRSTNPETLKAEGYNIPSSEELKKLPQGQYKLADIVKHSAEPKNYSNPEEENSHTDSLGIPTKGPYGDYFTKSMAMEGDISEKLKKHYHKKSLEHSEKFDKEAESVGLYHPSEHNYKFNNLGQLLLADSLKKEGKSDPFSKPGYSSLEYDKEARRLLGNQKVDDYLNKARLLDDQRRQILKVTRDKAMSDLSHEIPLDQYSNPIKNVGDKIEQHLGEASFKAAQEAQKENAHLREIKDSGLPIEEPYNATKEAMAKAHTKSQEVEAFTRPDVERHSSEPRQPKSLEELNYKIPSAGWIHPNGKIHEVLPNEMHDTEAKRILKANHGEDWSKVGFGDPKGDATDRMKSLGYLRMVNYSDTIAADNERKSIPTPAQKRTLEDAAIFNDRKHYFYNDNPSNELYSQEPKQEDTPEFKKWFGNSKVVDKEGKPKIVYHGTTKDFTQFDKNKIGSSTDEGYLGKGFYFNTHSKSTEAYAGAYNKDTSGGNIMPVYLKIEHPVPDQIQDKASTLFNDNPAKMTEYFKSLGYDGISNRGEHVVFEPNQIKSAIGNRGTFDSSDPDIRHSSEPKHEVVPGDPTKTSFSRLTEAQNDRVRKIDAKVAHAGDLTEQSKDLFEAKFIHDPMAKALGFRPTTEELNRVGEYMHQMYRKGESDITLNPKEQKVLDVWKPVMQDAAKEANKSGLLKEDRSGNLRKGSESEWYFPAQLNDKTIEDFTKRIHTPETQEKLSRWADLAVENSHSKLTKEEALKNIRAYVESLGGRQYHNIEFGPMRKAAGYGVPDDMRETNFIKATSKYGRRSAADLAYWKHLQSDPYVAARLGLPKREGGKSTLDGINSIAGHPDVQGMMKILFGDFNQKQNQTATSFIRASVNSLLGTATGIRNTVQVPSLFTPYLQSVKDVGAFFKAFSNLREAKRDSITYGARSGSMDLDRWNTHESPNKFAEIFNKIAEVARKYSGRDLMEQSDRIYSFAVGKELAKTKLYESMNNNQKATKWLEQFNLGIDKPISEYGEHELNLTAKNIVDRTQGTYDSRGLPVGVFDSQYAPFFSLSRWAIEKSNTIWKDVMNPAITGKNYLPLLTYTLGTVLSGAAIRKLNELMSGKKDYTPSLSEANAEDNKSYYVAALVNLMQQGSYMGIVGDTAKVFSDTFLQHELPRGPVSFPAADFLTQTLGKNLSDWGTAMENGEGIESTFKLISNIAKSSIQNYRMLDSRFINSDETERQNKFRDMRTFNKLEGEEVPPVTAMTSNPLDKLDERTFKHTGDLGEAAKMLPGLISDAIEKSKGDPYKLKRELNTLKENNYQTFPNMEKAPLSFVRYITYLTKTQGADVAQERLTDYLLQNAKNQAKSSMVPSM